MGTALKRTTIFLTEEQHERLRRLAFEQRTSMAKLLRDAALEILEDEEDISPFRISSSSSNISRAASRRSLAMEVRCSKARRRSLSCCSSVRKIVVRFSAVPIDFHLLDHSSICASLCQYV